MRATLVLTLLLTASGCSAPEPVGNAIDINAAAEAARGDIDTYAADRLEPSAPAPTAEPSAGVSAATVPIAALDNRAEATAAPAPGRYACAGRTRVSVRRDDRADTATIDRPGAPSVVLTRQQAASGIWYAGEGYELRGKDRDARFTAPGGAPVACTAER